MAFSIFTIKKGNVPMDEILTDKPSAEANAYFQTIISKVSLFQSLWALLSLLALNKMKEIQRSRSWIIIKKRTYGNKFEEIKNF